MAGRQLNLEWFAAQGGSSWCAGWRPDWLSRREWCWSGRARRSSSQEKACLRLDIVQLAGRNPTSIDDFVRGQRGFVGSVLGRYP